jgi:hypothetical protein
MKKLIYIILSLLLISCTESNVPKTSTRYHIINNYTPLDLVVIDSCEYLFGEWGNATVLTHKGNCKNHKNK